MQLQRDEGASTVEYGLIVSAIAAVIALTVYAFGAYVSSSVTKTSTCIQQEAASTC
jgi:Flp pilus assembly pilin Flp